MATTYYLRNTGGTLNWNSNASWSTVSPVSAVNTGTFPIAGDTATLNALSTSNLTINVSSACISIDCTGYAGTLTHSNLMNTTGNVTFSAGMTLTSTATWSMGTGGGTIQYTPAGQTISTLSPATSGTINNVGGKALCVNLTGTSTITITGNGIDVSGTINTSATYLSTLPITMTGTGNISTGASTNAYPLVINTAGTITQTGNITFAGNVNSSFTIIAGTFDANGRTLGIRGNMIFDLRGGHIYNLTHTTGTATITFLSAFFADGTYTDSINGTTTFSGSFLPTFGNVVLGLAGGITTTIVLSNNVTITNNLSATSGGSGIINGAFTVSVGGIDSGSASGLSGTASILFNSTGTWTGSGGPLNMNTTINTSGTITLSGRPMFGGSAVTLTYTAGTITDDGTCILTIDCQASAVVFGLPTTLNLTSLTLMGKTGGSITVPSSKTINISSKFRCVPLPTGSVTQTFSLLTGTPGVQTKIIPALSGFFPIVSGILATDIDSSGGFPVLNQGGSLSNTTNWMTTWDTYDKRQPVELRF